MFNIFIVEMLGFSETLIINVWVVSMELYKLIWCVVFDLLTLCWFVICQHLQVDLNKHWWVQSDWCECWLPAFSLVMEKLRECLNAPYQKTRPYLETLTPDRHSLWVNQANWSQLHMFYSVIFSTSAFKLWPSHILKLRLEFRLPFNPFPSQMRSDRIFHNTIFLSFCSSSFLSTDVCSWWFHYQ